MMTNNVIEEIVVSVRQESGMFLAIQVKRALSQTVEIRKPFPVDMMQSDFRRMVDYAMREIESHIGSECASKLAINHHG
jgi:hypothetical protein